MLWVLECNVLIAGLESVYILLKLYMAVGCRVLFCSCVE